MARGGRTQMKKGFTTQSQAENCHLQPRLREAQGILLFGLTSLSLVLEMLRETGRGCATQPPVGTLWSCPVAGPQNLSTSPKPRCSRLLLGLEEGAELVHRPPPRQGMAARASPA